MENSTVKKWAEKTCEKPVETRFKDGSTLRIYKMPSHLRAALNNKFFSTSSGVHWRLK